MCRYPYERCSPMWSHNNFFFLIMRQPPISTFFPYTTFFRSDAAHLNGREQGHQAALQPLRHAGGISVQKQLREPREHFVANRLAGGERSEEHTSELQSLRHLVCRLLLE